MRKLNNMKHPLSAEIIELLDIESKYTVMLENNAVDDDENDSIDTSVIVTDNIETENANIDLPNDFYTDVLDRNDTINVNYFYHK